MYSTSTTSTTTSESGRTAAGASVGDRRVRIVRLIRPRRATPAFGFSLRGGKEHGSGFFISKVEFSSEAHLQGLRAGDQLVSVNGYWVDDAIHAELVHYLASQSRLKLKVRHVGMLPVKEKAHESMSWQFVSDCTSFGSDASSSPTLCHEADGLTEMRLSILVPAGAKLGCGICKGPEWKPGIFVQFVREGGIAREAGLRPGDQILSCNNLNFGNVSFNEAISAMKACGRLELLVREGAGTDLISPESSGYNSSASSAAGERSPASAVNHLPLAPPAALRRRLASVAEEAADRADRLTMNRLKRRTCDSLDFDWNHNDTHNFDTPSDIEPDYDSPSIPNNPHTFESKSSQRNSKEFVTSPSNKTIINLTENGATIQCSYNNQTPRKSTFAANTNRGNDKKTIVVEVHHTSTTACGKPTCNNLAPPMQKDFNFNSDTASVSSSTTLSSAIAEEIQRRKQNKKISSPESSNPLNPGKKNVPKCIDNEQKIQHDALMNEFKKVHRKMFASTNGDNKTDSKKDEKDDDSQDRKQPLPLKKLDHAPSNIPSKDHIQQKREATDNPPPPPPMPTLNGYQNKQQDKDTEHQKPVSKLIADLKAPNCRKNGTLTRIPTPDYEKTNVSTLKSKKDDKAELQSLESYKLKNPASIQPKPPTNYFVKASNGTATMKKHIRPVSITIGEYGYNGNGRRAPTKLEFLNGDKSEDLVDSGNDISITNRLQSELAMTLSRSNLRKKTEALDVMLNENCVNSEDSDASLDKNFHLRYGNNLLPLSPSISIPKAIG